MTPSPPSGRRGRLLALTGWAAFAVAVAVGGPLFVRMPLWIDATLYQVAAAELLRGGVLYRDVFDTNFPGFVSALAVVQGVFGPNPAAVRAVDLVIVGLIVFLLARWARAGGGSAGAAAWVWAGAAWFYLGTSEFCQCQRDTWMLLPSAAAAWLRVRRLGSAALSPLSGTGRGSGGGVTPHPGQETPPPDPLPVPERGDKARFLAGFLEGVLWGLGVWVKPHVAVPALAVWFATLPHAVLAWGWRAAAADFAGLLAGGLVTGGVGVGLMALGGAWPHFLDVMTAWNPTYLDNTLAGVSDRVPWTFRYFTPWSLLHFAAPAVAAVNVVEATLPGRGWRYARWVYAPAADRPARVARLALAALYLGWAGQALVLQRHFHYAHVPDTLLALAVLAAQGWAVGLPCVLWLLGMGALTHAAHRDPQFGEWVRVHDPGSEYAPVQQPTLLNPDVLAHWPACFGPTTPELWDKLARDGASGHAPGWADLARVRDFLRRADPPARDGNVVAYCDSTHPLYLLLGVRPGSRFMHFSTAFEVDGDAGRIQTEIQARRVDYVVSDLRRMTEDGSRATDPGSPGPLDLPAWLPVSQRRNFPWDLPVVFRSGRYLVHRVDRPVGPVVLPWPSEFDKLGPGQP